MCKTYFRVIRTLVTGALFLTVTVIILTYAFVLVIFPAVLSSSTATVSDIITCGSLILALVVFSGVSIFQLVIRKEIVRKILQVLRVLSATFLVTFLVYQLIDADKPRELHTLADQAITDSHLLQTSRLLQRFLDDSQRGLPAVSDYQDKKSFHNIINDQDQIRKAWHDIDPHRETISQLLTFKSLRHHFDGDEVFPNYNKLRQLGSIYQAYALLLARTGNVDESVRTIITIHELSRKALQGSVNLVQKMVWLAILENNLRVVSLIADEASLDNEHLLTLTSAFQPLTTDELSFYQVWIGEYLLGMLKLHVPARKIIEFTFFPELGNPPPLLLAKTPPWLFAIFYHLTFQENRTAIALNTYWHSVIARSRVGLGNDSDTATDWLWQNKPQFRNLSGWSFHRPFDFQLFESEPLGSLEFERRAAKIKEQSDRLATHLAER